MESYGKIKVLPETVWWASTLLMLWGVVFVQLAGAAVPCSDISEVLRRDQKELALEFISQGNNSGRLLRGNRQRNSIQGRTLNLRSGCEGAVHASPGDFLASFRFSPSGTLYSKIFKENNFWTDFIISALPVRAGPAKA